MTVQCFYCKKLFEKLTHDVKRSPKHFCSHFCTGKQKSIDTHTSVLPCTQCGRITYRRRSQLRRSKNKTCFCSRSCSATYNNKYKQRSRRSTCEIELYRLLTTEFPTLSIIPNDKTLLGGYEVDVAFPTLNCAIEWNGIVHFKPIYGPEKFQKIQCMDKKKLELAHQRNIKLIVISDLLSTKQFVYDQFVEIRPIIQNLLSNNSGR